MNKVKIGMVGAGNIACVHLTNYVNIKEAEVVALCDIDEERLNETGDKYGIERRYTDIDSMIKDNPELDAVDVCVWNCSHKECTVKALEAGLNVLCEKPMAYNVEESIEMKRVAEKNNKILMIGFVTRFSDEACVARDMIEKGYLGDIYYAKARYVRRHGNPGGWFCDKARSGGGPVIDLGVHVIDLVRNLMGNPKPVSVYAVAYNKLGNRPHIKNGVSWQPKDANENDICDVEDFASALIRFDNGAAIDIEASYDFNGEPESKRILYGTKAGFDLDNCKLYTVFNDYLADIAIDTNELKCTGTDFEKELQNFVDCVLGKCTCTACADDGIEVMKILDAIYRSAETGHEIIL